MSYEILTSADRPTHLVYPVPSIHKPWVKLLEAAVVPYSNSTSCLYRRVSQFVSRRVLAYKRDVGAGW